MELELRKMTERSIWARRKYARQNNMLDRMVEYRRRPGLNSISTSAFRRLSANSCTARPRRSSLDMAWVYGLIRQESRLIMNALRHVAPPG